MNKTKTFISLFVLPICLSLLLSGQTQAEESKLISPKTFQVIAINGKRHSNRFLQEHQSVPLRTGMNKLALQYSTKWRVKNSKAVTEIKSKIFIVTFNLAEASNVKLTYLKPANLNASINFSKKPQFLLKNDGNRSLNINIEFLSTLSNKDILKKTKPSLTIKKRQKTIIL